MQPPRSSNANSHTQFSPISTSSLQRVPTTDNLITLQTKNFVNLGVMDIW